MYQFKQFFLVLQEPAKPAKKIAVIHISDDHLLNNIVYQTHWSLCNSVFFSFFFFLSF